MSGTGEVAILITTPTGEEARHIASVLLEQRKAACVNIVTGVKSLFWWQGKTDAAEESLLIVKSKASLIEQITALVKAAHSYQVPEVIVLPIVGGNEDYLKWIEGEVQES